MTSGVGWKVVEVSLKDEVRAMWGGQRSVGTARAGVQITRTAWVCLSRNDVGGVGDDG